MRFKIQYTFIIIVTSFFLYSNSYAQDDSLRVLEQNLEKVTTVNHSPKAAVLLSTALPGLGQIYNKSYWKVPVIYAGFYGLGVMFQRNNTGYQLFKKAYSDNLEASLSTFTVDGEVYSLYQAKIQRDAYRRSRDLSLIFMGALYGLNIIEAYVDAHMFSFDVSDDLSINYQPSFFVNNQAALGLQFRLQF